MKNDLYEIRVVDAWPSEEIIALYQAGGWWKEGYDSAKLPSLIVGSFVFAVVIEKKSGRAIGMGRVLSDGISDGYLQDRVMLPSYRGKGLGKQLVTTLVSKCLEKGLSWIGVIAEPGSESFYTDLGFTPMKRHQPLLYHGGK